ncbi:MAG TPA: glutathione ABC transporter permease GsiC, partial [Lapillicoccus sp.]
MIRAVLGNGVVRKVGGALLTLLGVAVVVFVMLRAIPGNQITANLGTEAAALTPAQQEALRSYYGLD